MENYAGLKAKAPPGRAAAVFLIPRRIIRVKSGLSNNRDADVCA